MITLLIDIGNTAIKWTYTLEGKKFAPIEKSPKENFLKHLHKQWEGIPNPQHILISNVAGELHGSALQAYCMKYWAQTPYFAYSRPECAGVKNGYKETYDLGVDRWLAAVGAYHAYNKKKACCIIDCGTAITYDVVNKGGEFLGGYILPSLDLTIRALNSGTRKINLTPQDISYEPLAAVPNDTQSAVEQGHIAIISGALNTLNQHVVAELGEQPEVILCGGNSELWAKQLPFDASIDLNLVFKGLLLDFAENNKVESAEDG